MPSRDDLIDDLRSAAFSAGRAISTAECDAALKAAGGEYNGALLLCCTWACRPRLPRRRPCRLPRRRRPRPQSRT